MTRNEQAPSVSAEQTRGQLSAAEYEHIGRTFETIVVSGYAGKRRLLVLNFLRGLSFGIGSAIGATLVIALMLFVLNLFSEIPLVGDLFEKLQRTVEQSQTTP